MSDTRKKNILYNIATIRLLDRQVIQAINKQLGIGNSYAVVGYEKELSEFTQESKCIYREKAVVGDYEHCDFIKPECYKPLDDETLDAMAPYLLQLMKMQQRFETQEQFRMPNTMIHHETLLMKNIEFWNNFLDCQEIDYVLFNQVPHEVYDNIIYYLCKIKQIKTVVIYWSTLPNRSVMATAYERIEAGLLRELEEVKIQYQDSKIEDINLCSQVEEHYENMRTIKGRKAQVDQWYIRVSSLDSVFRAIFGYRNLKDKLVLEIGAHTKKSDNTLVKMGIAIINAPKIISSIWKQRGQIRYIGKRWKKTKKLHEQYASYAIEPQQVPYLYFALHFAPEATVAPMGGGLYMEQIIPIKILDCVLPKEWKIYVKIHPAQVYNEQVELLIQSLCGMPRVCLIQESYPTLQLIEHAKVVATLTGTAAWEAQYMDVPALLFGYTEKSYAPLAHYVRTIEDCKQVIEQIMREEQSCDPKELKLFVKALENVSFPNAYYEEDKQELIENAVRLLTK